MKPNRNLLSKPRSSSIPSKEVYRLFVDPASISSGWAWFRDRDLVLSGTIAVDKKLSVFDRIEQIHRRYAELPLSFHELHEVHIESLPRRCHIYTHWSVGCIGLALNYPSVKVFADIPVQSWQKAVLWKTTREPLKGYKVKSEDELAAIGMGLYYTRKYA